jgi:hypothetical protein
MFIRLARFLWCWIEPVYLDASQSGRGKPASLCRFRHWEILVESFEEIATPERPRQIEWWLFGQDDQRSHMLLQCGRWRWSVRYLAALLCGRYSQSEGEEPPGGAAVGARISPRKPGGLPPMESPEPY